MSSGVAHGSASWIAGAHPAGADPAGADPADTGPADTPERVRRLLDATSMPATLADELIVGAPPEWFDGEPAVLAGELALCHPELGTGEVRALGRPAGAAGRWRLGVVAHDRPHLLERARGALAGEQLTVTQASAFTWSDLDVCLLRLVVSPTAWVGTTTWSRVGSRLRAACGGPDPRPRAARRPAACGAGW